ncbi:hypothetical protein ACTFIU_003673 [Dictyostelium citrinum]
MYVVGKHIIIQLENQIMQFKRYRNIILSKIWLEISINLKTQQFNEGVIFSMASASKDISQILTSIISNPNYEAIGTTNSDSKIGVSLKINDDQITVFSIKNPNYELSGDVLQFHIFQASGKEIFSISAGMNSFNVAWNNYCF